MDTNNSRFRSVIIGTAALILLWVSAGISVPLVKRYSHFRPEALLIVRGVAVALAFFVFKQSPEKPDRYVLLGGLLLAVSSITFFQALNLWGPNPVIIVITLTPLVNFGVAAKEKRAIGPVAILSLALVLVGVSMALDVLREGISFPGLALSLLATLTAGLGIEAWSKAKEGASAKMGWYSFCLVPLAFTVLLLTQKKIIFVPVGTGFWTAFYVFVVIGCLSGVAYLYSAGVVIEKLGPTKGSILLQGETPAVIIGSWYLMGDRISLRQGFGVGLMLLGISILMVHMAHTAKKTSTPSG